MFQPPDRLRPPVPRVFPEWKRGANSDRTFVKGLRKGAFVVSGGLR